jgi:hypothetical protein
MADVISVELRSLAAEERAEIHRLEEQVYQCTNGGKLAEADRVRIPPAYRSVMRGVALHCIAR